MARAYASRIIGAPVEAVWDMVRDFNALPKWNPGVTDSTIEDGLSSDVVGCVRSFHLGDGAHVRERLLSLDDSCYAFTYNFETPAFPVENYIAGMELIPVTSTDQTFVQWWANFDEKPEDQGKYVDIVSNAVFAAGLEALAGKVKGRAAPDDVQRWQGLRPAKVFTSSVIGGPVDESLGRRCAISPAWGGWHDDITRMHMIDGVRSDKVSGVRDFLFWRRCLVGAAHLPVGYRARLPLSHPQEPHALAQLITRAPGSIR